MKNIFKIILFFSFCISYSQNGMVEYGYIESLGLGNALGLDYNAQLLFNKNNSNYITCKSSLEKSEKINETKIVKEDGEIKAVFNGMGVSEDGNQVFYSNINKQMYSTLQYDEMIYINDGVVDFKWEISKETKKIGRFICYKATAPFRGRNYTAWFAPEIPVPFGPWKLNGLPGLILEAYDNSKFIFWYFKNLEYPLKKSQVIKTIIENETVNYIDYTIFKTLIENKSRKIEEKNIIFMKENLGVNIISPNLKDLFLECE